MWFPWLLMVDFQTIPGTAWHSQLIKLIAGSHSQYRCSHYILYSVMSLWVVPQDKDFKKISQLNSSSLNYLCYYS